MIGIVKYLFSVICDALIPNNHTLKHQPMLYHAAHEASIMTTAFNDQSCIGELLNCTSLLTAARVEDMVDCANVSILVGKANLD